MGKSVQNEHSNRIWKNNVSSPHTPFGMRFQPPALTAKFRVKRIFFAPWVSSKLPFLSNIATGKTLQDITTFTILTSLVFITRKKFKHLLLFNLLWLYNFLWQDIFYGHHGHCGHQYPQLPESRQSSLLTVSSLTRVTSVMSVLTLSHSLSK